ncbi:uncharacterized protein LACBIDRAFT_296376 [Laccaria bicolor S238N-H82]|uniref:Predicted protein n=1 Tax=Laccaria bicolor (strain S238N-H82 / ATCC MYA-4686) TaxID=486041 RepID=B0D8N0_LACBS|nr:uncharacterized protein LACBIDRAFT_296376 [Laccaria bicolor S238N-H82]EDR09099.1 predicted protein [Laccaria bicolor S238N-H82]|eukprot:XP_001880412.1 predicted protein [Laccaria bicolor S238N-H82]
MRFFHAQTTNDEEYSLNSSRQSTASFIAFLPPEILAAIFVYARPTRRLRRKLAFEVTLSHVCMQWRGVALTTPALWTTIDISSTKSLSWAPVYLQRSGDGLPLDIRVDIYAEDRLVRHSASKNTAIVQAVRDLIGLYIGRCRSLLVFTFHEETASLILSRLHNVAAPLLERLRINAGCVSQPFADTTAAASCILSGGAPRLRFLETETMHCFPLANLETLHLHRLHNAEPIEYEQLTQIFAALPALSNLSIRGPIHSSQWPLHLTAPTFLMSSLRSLMISEDGPFAVKFLLSVSAPSLQSLWLDCSIDNTTLFEAPQMLAGNKFPVLKYLTLESYSMYTTNSFAGIFPTITHLHLSYAALFHVKHFEGAMVAEPTIWGQLATLIVTARKTDHARKFFGSLCRILPDRRRAEAPLQSLLLDGDLLRFLLAQKSDLLHEHVTMEELHKDNYSEFWWVNRHEDTVDRIGVPLIGEP